MVKKNFKRVLSILLCMMMILSTLPMSVFAEGEAATTTEPVVDGTYTGENWAVAGNGTITHNINGTDVSLSKTAVPAKDEEGKEIENAFDITLKVETSTTTTTQTDGGAVVLVIDVSGSMDYCAECGGDGYHDRDCDHYGWVTTAQSRMNAAKIAATNFLKSYAGTDADANRMLAIVSFSTQASTKLQWVNVAGGDGCNSYDNAESVISSLDANGGTNLDQGLATARDLLTRNEVSQIASKNVIALTDGVPTYYGTRPSGGGSSGSQATNNATATSAKALRDTGATLYTVCFGVANEKTYWNGPTVGNFLRDSVASSGCAYNADNSKELYDAFAAITKSITSGLKGDGWTATDPMGAHIQAVVSEEIADHFKKENDVTYTWSLSDPEIITNGNVTTYVYSITYRIQFDTDFEGFKNTDYYPTNGPTYLTIDGKQYAFPVPGVKGKETLIDIGVTKVWKDADNQDGLQPEVVTVELYKNGEATGDIVDLNAESDWTKSFTGLSKYDVDGNLITYTVKEVDVPDGYESVEGNKDNQYTITNTHEVYTKNIIVTKIWYDENNRDNSRPESITVKLMDDKTVMGTATLTAADADEDGNWVYTFRGMPVNRVGEVGQKINYTATEDAVDGYVVGYGYDQDTLTITNSYTPQRTSVTVTKVWEDDNNRDNARPNTITLYLKNGNDIVKTKELTVDKENNSQIYTFENLYKYEDGKEIAYTVEEAKVEGYTPKIAGSQANGYTITNTHEIETIEIKGEKTWAEDNENADGLRSEYITINLLADGDLKETKIVAIENEWKWDFGKLPKYKEGEVGKEIIYTVTEDAVAHYVSEVNGYNVTNTYNNGYISIPVTKEWNDDSNRDGIRPEDVTVALFANGEKTGDTLVLNSGNNWSGSFEVLMKDAKGNDIAYSVKEVLPKESKYISSVRGSEEEGFVITNTHTPEVVEVSGSKTWNDNDNQDGVRPDSITINLLANGKVIETVKVTEEDKWTWNFTDLPKFENGVEIEYTVTEEAVEDYSATYEGYNVTNTHTPEKTSVTVAKSWEDNNDQDGIRPDVITLLLLADGEETDKTLELSEDNNWRSAFTELDVYANGKKIVYTVDEIEVKGYVSEITGDATKGFTITNTHEPEKTVVAGKKTWDDANNQDGKRPEVIEINVFGNGVLLETVKVTEAEGWAWSFNLPKYVNGGQEVAYAITENAVEGYTATYEGYNVTNSYTPEETGFSVSKVWADSDDADGIRPDEVEIKLFANGEDTGIVLVLSEETKWVGSINGLPKYWEGEEIVYTVEEVAVKGYNTVIKGTVEEGFTVTNSHVVIPDTGDNRNPVVWISLMAGAVLTAGVALFTKKRKTAK